MKKNCFLLVLLAVLLVLSSCAVPATDNPGNDEKTDSEFFCYAYVYDANHKPKGGKYIFDAKRSDAYNAWQEKSEYVIPETLTVRMPDKEYTLPRDPSVSTKVVYRIRNDEGKTIIAADTDFYGSILGFTLFNYNERKQNKLDEDSRPSEAELIAKAKAFAVTTWEGVYDIEGATVRLHEVSGTRDLRNYNVNFSVKVNGYEIARPTVTIDMNGEIWQACTYSAVGGIKQSDYQVPSFPEEQMKAAADEYLQKSMVEQELTEEELSDVIVKMIDLFNGQRGLMFTYRKVSGLIVIVLTEEYAEPAAK